MNKVLILLTICIIVVVILIYVGKTKKSNESFYSSTAPASTASTAPAVTQPIFSGDHVKLTYSLNNEMGGPIVYLYNILNFSNVFYELDYKNERQCSDTSECMSNEECVGDDIMKCHKIIDRQAFKLNSQYGSFVELPNLDVDKISVSFMVLLTDVTQNQPIVYSKNGLWDVVVVGSKFVVNTYSDTGIDTVELGSFSIKNKKIYEFVINIEKNDLIISINDSIHKIALVTHTCSTDRDCNDGICVGNTNRYCDYNRETLFFGKANKVQDNPNMNEYMDGYVGEIKIKTIKMDTLCKFDSGLYKIRKNCMDACLSEEGCSSIRCEDKCAKIPVCKFKSKGRHRMDCLQKCVADNDCNAEHCIEMCEKCNTSCPWNKVDEYESYGSQYIDPNGKPSPLKLVLERTSIDGTKITLRWKSPMKGKFEILGYICYIYKTFSKGEGVKIHKISKNNCDNDTEICDYIVTDLKPEETYTIGIKAYNMLGLSGMSNMITFKPSVKTINKDFNIVPDISQDLIGTFNYCNVSEELDESNE